MKKREKRKQWELVDKELRSLFHLKKYQAAEESAMCYGETGFAVPGERWQALADALMPLRPGAKNAK